MKRIKTAKDIKIPQKQVRSAINRMSFIIPLLLLSNMACTPPPKKKLNNPLFAHDSLISLTLSAPFQTIFDDIDEKRFYHAATLVLGDSIIPISVRTRGHYRRDTALCKLLPLKLKFKKKAVKGTLFHKQSILKLALPCTTDHEGQQLLLREYLCYKLYAQLTPLGFRTRLFKIEVHDTENGLSDQEGTGFLIEHKKKLGKRNHGKIRDTPYLEDHQMNRYMHHFMEIFQYMIGNDDWSIHYLHNIEMLYSDEISGAVPIPYDFDMSRFVDPPYASHDTVERLQDYFEELPSKEEVEYIFQFFVQQKDSLISVIHQCPQLDSTHKQACLQHLEQFYDSIPHTSGSFR